MASKLDPNQITKLTYDEANQAVKTVPAGVTTFAVELDADDGDSVQDQGRHFESSALSLGAGTGEIVPEVACVGARDSILVVKTASTIVGPQQLDVEVSPTDAGDIWIVVGNVTPDLTLNNVVSVAISNIVARRIRVTSATPVTSGTFDAYLIARG